MKLPFVRRSQHRSEVARLRERLAEAKEKTACAKASAMKHKRALASFREQYDQHTQRHDLKLLRKRDASAECDLSYRPFASLTDQSLVQIEQTWSNDLDVGISGFVVVKAGKPQDLQILCEGTPPTLIEWHDRPDVSEHPAFTDYDRHVQCGFRAWFRLRAHHRITLDLAEGGSSEPQELKLDATGFSPIPPTEPAGMCVNEFAEWVNRECRNVLEIGSRVVSPGSVSKRALFDPHVQYTGFDFYADSNTDIVGDAHTLSQHFPADTTFDAIFSLSVLEHLAMPWKVALEINKLLPIGGLAFHSTPFTWPLHETPWDFWRFSHEGLRALFSPALGFEVISLGLTNPCRIHFETPTPVLAHNALHPAFGESNILVRKVSEPSTDDFRWHAALEQVVLEDSAYPNPNAIHA